MTTARALALTCAFLLLPSLALAQNPGLRVDATDGTTATVQITNPFTFDIEVANVRLEFANDDNSRTFYYSQPNWHQAIEAEGAWTGSLQFQSADGTSGHDLAAYDGYSVAAGVHIPSLEGPAQEAIASGEADAIRAQLAVVRPRVAPVSRSSRFHAEQIALSGLTVDEWFNLERIDALVAALEEALIEIASARIIDARNHEARREVFEELAPAMREDGLHITDINSEARLAMAQALIAGDRPQDALLFKETDDDGNLLPEWEPIYIQAALALARAAADLEVSVFSSLRPAMESLNEVRELDPDNADLAAVAGRLVPMSARWVIQACEPMTRDLENAMVMLELLRPEWSEYEVVEQAATAVGETLVEVGLGFCERREFINARNRFVVGERLLEGVAAWEDSADEINRCRARGALAEGRDIANTAAEANNISNQGSNEGDMARAMEKLDEALGRFDLPASDTDAFRTDIAAVWVRIAERQLEEFAFDAARSSLQHAEEISPTGLSDAGREAWLLYAEKRYEFEGLLMKGTDIDDARAAIERAGDIDPDRASAISGKLTTAFYGYRVGIPALGLLLAALAGVLALNNKRKAKRLADMADDEY